MRFIDEKGKLFGLVNLFDFLIVLFLLCLIPAAYFGYRVMTTNKPLLPEEGVHNVLLHCQFVKLRPEIAKKISVGDKERDVYKGVIGDVMMVGEAEPDENDPALKQCSVSLKLRLELKGASLYYKDSLIDYGSEFIFNTKKYSAAVKVREELTRMLKVRITLKELDEHTADLVKVGDREIDFNGRTIAEIMTASKPTESFREFELSRGKFTIGKIVDKKQIATEMILKCYEISDEIYFKGKPLVYTTPVEFVTDKYKIRGFLSKQYEITQGSNSSYSFDDFPSEKDQE